METLAEIQFAIHNARRRVFGDDPADAEAAAADIRRLLGRLRRHPEERARRAASRAAQNEALLRRWE